LPRAIKSFKKGLAEDDKADAEPGKTEPVKTIDHQPPPARLRPARGGEPQGS